MADLLRADAERVGASLDAVTRSVRPVPGPPEEIRRLGEALGEQALDRLFGAAEAVAPFGRTLGLLESAARLGAGAAGAEPANKLAAFRSFRAGTRRGLGAAGAADDAIDAAIAGALGAGPDRALWLLEGLGYALAEGTDRSPPRSRRLLAGAAAREPRARIPLHTGMGLALARRALLRARRPAGSVGDAVATFLAACETLSARGCAPMAVEALGLMARQLHPGLLARLEAELRSWGEERVELLWHGVGRGLYFVPSALAAGVAAALAAARSEPPHAAGRRNALAGVAWAATLVNLRHPQVLEGVVRDHAGAIFDPPAFAHGVRSALVVWRATHGPDDRLARFLGHRPAGAAAVTWRRWVVEPASEVLAAGEVPEDTAAMAALFRCPGGGSRAEPLATPATPDLAGVDGWLGRALDALARVETGRGP